jgi:hypothetical protein
MLVSPFSYTFWFWLFHSLQTNLPSSVKTISDSSSPHSTSSTETVMRGYVYKTLKGSKDKEARTMARIGTVQNVPA